MSGKITSVSPLLYGWTRHSARPRTWKRPDGNFYTFPDGIPEELLLDEGFIIEDPANALKPQNALPRKQRRRVEADMRKRHRQG